MGSYQKPGLMQVGWRELSSSLGKKGYSMQNNAVPCKYVGGWRS
jgi:hypothetical protein